MVRNTKQWTELIALGEKLKGGPITDAILANILGADSPEEAREWFLIALLATHTDAIQIEREWLREKAATAPANAFVGFGGSLRSICEVMNDRFEERFGAPPGRVVSLFAVLSGSELPS